jgi:hypothetical protein
MFGFNRVQILIFRGFYEKANQFKDDNAKSYRIEL